MTRMPSSTYDFRQFQAELAALDKTKPASPAAPPPAEPAAAPKRGRDRPSTRQAEAERLARAREEFLALRARHGLTIADVVTFFPEEEGIAYLQSLLAQPAPRRRKRKGQADPDASGSGSGS